MSSRGRFFRLADSPERPGALPGRLSGADKPKQSRRKQVRPAQWRKPGRAYVQDIGANTQFGKSLDHDLITVAEAPAKRK